MKKLNKTQVMRAIYRLEWNTGDENPITDAALIRRYVNKQHQEISILRRYIESAAALLSDYGNGVRPDASHADGLVAEMRERANPKREKK